MNELLGLMPHHLEALGKSHQRPHRLTQVYPILLSETLE